MKKATEKVEPTFEDILRKNIHDGNGDCVIHQYENSDGVNFEMNYILQMNQITRSSSMLMVILLHKYMLKNTQVRIAN
jgi:hypothetical protein